ncbi:MAG: hypothetical protein AMXMBFR80_06500 [Dehalococcoidia bacterium]|jgi:hypothetical protein
MLPAPGASGTLLCSCEDLPAYVVMPRVSYGREDARHRCARLRAPRTPPKGPGQSIVVTGLHANAASRANGFTSAPMAAGSRARVTAARAGRRCGRTLP